MGALAKVAVAVAAVAALLPATTLAAYPGSNGKIAFERDGQIWTMNADGTGQLQLTNTAESSIEPQWSPDGGRIAYTRWDLSTGEREIRVMNADGSGDTAVVSADSPTWSPDGTRIGWVRSGLDYPFYPYVYLADSNLDGTQGRVIRRNQDTTEQYAAPMADVEWSPRGDQIALTTEELAFTPEEHSVVATVAAWRYQGTVYRSMSSTTADASEAAWSPDGMRLAFVEQALDPDTGEPVGFRQIYRINADKTGRVPLTTDASHKDDVEWSPDGSKLVFGKSDLWLMNTDGSGQTQLTSTAAVERDPDWQPIVPPPPPAGYPRPKHTAPMRLSLVPAFQECAAPNRTHGPPLAFPSCAPPIKGAVDLATGTADRNGAPENMEASLKVATVVGNASTGVDEADVSIQLSITDVRCTANSYGCGPSNAIGPNDYQDVLYPGLTLRITDRYNLPAPGGRSSGTSVDIPFFWGVLCAATADTSTGGSCTSNTTIDALAGGTAVEGRRAVIETGQAEVRARADAQPFLRQGVFVP